MLDDNAAELTAPVRLADVPLHVHARYTRQEILAAFGHGVLTTRREWREGVRYEPVAMADLLAFTLRKTEREFSPTTLYRDYAISRDLVHWESQSTLGSAAPTAQRYINHADRGSSILLFARPTKADRAFTFLGPARYVRHENERPLAIVWRLETPMPEAFFSLARADAA